MTTTHQENGFKLIAMKILSGCDENFSKILQTDTIYYFFNNYDIDPTTDKLSVRKGIPNDFFNQDSLKINISAIVGKNGSGKSSLIELLFRVINNYSRKQKFPKTHFQHLDKVNTEIYFHTDAYYKLVISGKEIRLNKYNKKGNLSKSPEPQRSAEHFFYTIAVNYSHYAYNTLDLDATRWIDSLFHKNDGYQTPLVINPFRKEGNIDINVENHLVVSRLIANFLTQTNDGKYQFRNVSDNLIAYALKLTLNKSKRKTTLWVNGSKKSKSNVTLENLVDQRDLLLSTLNKIYPFKYESLNKQEYEIALDYIYYKLVSICLKYADYEEFFNKKSKSFNIRTIEKFSKDLIEDPSHIAFKLKQTLNFLLFQNLKMETQIVSLDTLQDDILRLKVKHNISEHEVAEMVPPPIFQVEILLSPEDSPETVRYFSKLSSGEKQFIYSSSSVLYHLNNLNSIVPTRKRIAYKNIFIVLEEIELYFHPEMQRKYVQSVLTSISNLSLSRLESIHLCFVTHSPFILSDIPTNNILFLGESGNALSHQMSLKTFGANIHDLLKQSFFLENGAIGDFAINKINDTINFLNLYRLRYEISELQNSKIPHSTDVLKGLQEEEKNISEIVICMNPVIHEEVITLIDEPILKQKLAEMFDEYANQNLQEKLIDEKIKALEAQKASLKK